MRNPTDFCLLCKTNFANKKNSHIYPRFLSTNFLAPNGGAGRGYELGGDKILNSRIKTIQDSPKENYILCDECESFFSVLEGIASATFIDWKEKVSNGEFSLKKIFEGLDVIESKTIDIKTVTLLIYSIFWRVSISSLKIFKDVKLVQSFENDLRIILLDYKSTKKNDYLNLLGKKPEFQFFPFSIITAKSFKDETANILCAPFSYNPYCIIVDRYSFMLFRTVHEINESILKEFCNLSADICKMMIFSQKLWYDAILKRAFETLRKQTSQHLN
ncbi:MAG: hypothetical protein Q8934_23245 [Bacillota bacterium]|nr:hypothetical protein [Bacillota bacterium]